MYALLSLALAGAAHPTVPQLTPCRVAQPIPAPLADVSDGAGRYMTDGDTVVFGDAVHDDPLPFSGIAHVLRYMAATDSLAYEASLRPSVPQERGAFGEWIAIEDDLVVVGAPGSSAFGVVGAVYVFRRVGNTWVEEARVEAPTGDPADFFGRRVGVGMDGARERFAVAAPRAVSYRGMRDGAVFVYERSAGSWVLRERIEPTIDPSEPIEFGARMVFDGRNLVASVIDSSSDRHAIYRLNEDLGFFVLEGWTFPAVSCVLSGGDVYAGGRIGRVSDVDLAVKVSRRDPVTATWVEDAEPIFVAEHAKTGSILTIDDAGTRILVPGDDRNPPATYRRDPSGAWHFERFYPAPPSATTFEPSSWGPVASLQPGSVCMIGSRYGDGTYFFHDPSCRPIGLRTCPQTEPNSAGEIGRLTVLGDQVASVNDVALRATGLPPSSPLAFLTSASFTTGVMPPGSAGTLCLRSPRGRYFAPGDLRLADAGGRAELRIDLTAIPEASAFVAATRGETRYFQAWYRDAGPTPVSRFTDGVEVQWR